VPYGTITFATPKSEIVHVTNSQNRKTLVIPSRWLVPAVAKLGEFKTHRYQQGEIEIDGLKHSGEIEAVFEDGRVLFSYRDQNETRQFVIVPTTRISNIENVFN
jgi:hypothetical protein